MVLIGVVDLILTAVLHAQGLIVELNPLMKVFIEKSEWLFAIVKGATLISAWYLMVSYARSNLAFVRTASLVGSALYVTIWVTWFSIGKP